MHARTTSITAPSAEALERGISYVSDEVLPALRRLDGFVGLSLLADRDSGRCIVTAAYQNEHAMVAAADEVQPLRQRALELMGAQDAEVTQWEIAVMHRDHRTGPGACVRALWVELDPANIDRAIDVFRMGALPTIEQMPGFCSASMMVDRAAGRAVSSVSFDSRETLDASREQARQIRERATGEVGARILDVAEFELALAHLDVPEMA